MTRKIAHLDMDAFYVSVELLRRPELRERPVIVAGSGPRAVVTTASYEAREFGVGSAMPAARARRLCPDGIFIPPDMRHYQERSREVMATLRSLRVPVEPVSLDEAYLDLSEVPDPIARMSSVVKRIRAELGLDASVGIGPNKVVAKVASDAEKPRGFVVLTREQAVERFADERVGLIPGIGPKTQARLRSYGVTTLGQLQRCTVAGLIERFGEHHGRALHERSHFRSDSEVSEHRELKSRSVESTFDVDVADRDQLERILSGQARRLGAELAERKVAGRTIAIKVRCDDFSTFTRARSILEPTCDPETIEAVAVELLRDNLPGRPVRLLGVRVGSFGKAPAPSADPQRPSLLDSAL